jgi:hypothetical protein
MRKHFPHENWFRCETCEHLFTIRIPADASHPPETHPPKHSLSGRRGAWDD